MQQRAPPTENENVIVERENIAQKNLFVEKSFRTPRAVKTTPPAALFQFSPPPIPEVNNDASDNETEIIPFTLSHPSLRNNVSSVKKTRRYIDPYNVRKQKAHLACVARQNLPPSLFNAHLAKSYRLALPNNMGHKSPQRNMDRMHRNPNRERSTWHIT